MRPGRAAHVRADVVRPRYGREMEGREREPPARAGLEAGRRPPHTLTFFFSRLSTPSRHPSRLHPRAGYYEAIPNAGCVPCGTGNYCSGGEQPPGGIIAPCPNGLTTMTPTAGAAAQCVRSCPPGEFAPSPQAACQQCGVGFYCPGGDQGDGPKRFPCPQTPPPPYTTMTANASQQAQCVIVCAAGQYAAAPQVRREPGRGRERESGRERRGGSGQERGSAARPVRGWQATSQATAPPPAPSSPTARRPCSDNCLTLTPYGPPLHAWTSFSAPPPPPPLSRFCPALTHFFHQTRLLTFVALPVSPLLSLHPSPRAPGPLCQLWGGLCVPWRASRRPGAHAVHRRHHHMLGDGHPMPGHVNGCSQLRRVRQCVPQRCHLRGELTRGG